MYLAGGISTTDYNMYVIRCFIILHKYVSNVCKYMYECTCNLYACEFVMCM